MFLFYTSLYFTYIYNIEIKHIKPFYDMYSVNIIYYIYYIFACVCMRLYVIINYII